ncbi:hypothetical protein NSB04_21065, partial [Blautia pseudococcoides]|nr:hypothetical protein [Blautia pseudococcoides]
WHGEKCNVLYAVDVYALKFYRLFLTTVFKEHKKEITAYLKQIPGEKERQEYENKKSTGIDS